MAKFRLLVLDARDWLAEDRSRLYDLAAALGGLLVVIGLAWVWPPLGFISLGLGLVAVGMLCAKAWAFRRRREEEDKSGWGE